MDFAVLADHRRKLKESEKRDKYFDLDTNTKGLIQGLDDLKRRGRVETIQIMTLLRSARILRRVLETWNTLTAAQTPMRNYRLMLVWKTLKRVK